MLKTMENEFLLRKKGENRKLKKRNWYLLRNKCGTFPNMSLTVQIEEEFYLMLK